MNPLCPIKNGNIDGSTVYEAVKALIDCDIPADGFQSMDEDGYNAKSHHLFGVAVGDALGVPVEFESISFAFVHLYLYIWRRII